MKKYYTLLTTLLAASFLGTGTVMASDFTLWKEDGTIQELIQYVEDITDESSENFIPVVDRVAVFDLDGTLIGEQYPIYFEWLMFAQRVLTDPVFSSDEEMKEVAEAILLAGENRSIPEDIEEKESVLFGKAFDGMTTEEYRSYVDEFLSQNADGFDQLTFGEAYFRPMQEVVTYLEKNDFKVYICSGTDRDADRVMMHRFLDLPNYQVIGSDFYSEGTMHDEVYYLDYQFAPDEELMRDDTRIIKNVKSSKIVQIAQEIGQKPVLAFGNSTGDTSMFVYTTYENPYKSIAFCIVPDDNDREYAYPEKVEKLKGICQDNGWHAVSMKDDFLTIYGENVTKNEKNTEFVDSLRGITKEEMTTATSTETKIELDDTYMNVIKFGSGEKNLVILSGVSLCGLEGKGEAIATAYSSFTDDYTVYLFDRKKVLPEGYQVSDMAEDVYRVLDLLGVKEAAVYGVSQGGMMGLSLAANHPDFVKGLVVCSSQARATDTLKSVAAEWLKLAGEKDVVGLNRNFFEVVYSEDYLETYAEYLPALEKEGTPEDCERFEILAQACLNFDITDSLDQIKCEVLVLGDENDHTLGVEGTQELAELLDCPYYIYDQYSHAVYDEAPDIQERIYTFLQNLNY